MWNFVYAWYVYSTHLCSLLRHFCVEFVCTICTQYTFMFIITPFFRWLMMTTHVACCAEETAPSPWCTSSCVTASSLHAFSWLPPFTSRSCDCWWRRSGSMTLTLPRYHGVGGLKTPSWSILPVPCWGTADAKLKVPFMVKRELAKVLPSESGVGQSVATHASRTARNVYLTGSFQFSFVLQTLSLLFNCLSCSKHSFLRWPMEWNASPCLSWQMVHAVFPVECPHILTGSSACGIVYHECDSDMHLWFYQLYLKLQWNFDVFLDMKNENQRRSKHKIYLGWTKQCMLSEQISCARQWTVTVQKHLGNAVSEVN